MRKFFVSISVLLLSVSAYPQRLELSDQEKKTARSEARGAAKQFCVSFWTDPPSKVQLLSDLGIALDDQCRCTQESVDFLVSDELAAYATHALHEIRIKGEGKLHPVLDQKLDEFFKASLTAMQGCSAKLKRRP
jgi:hypothetical protein